jgi:anthranilate phosphoribosyltransferase
VIELRNGEIDHFRVDPAALGFAPARASDLTGGDRTMNAAVVRRVLAGESGPHRDIVVLNAAAGLVVAGRADSMAAGIEIATRSIDSGAAAATLERMATASQAAAA